MKLLKLGEAAKMINITEKTLQKWDKTGKLVAKRTKNNRRYYTEEQINDFLGIETPQKPVGETVIYARVSSHNQKDDLASQIEFVTSYANERNYKVDRVIKEIGSGLNYKRKKWNALLLDISNGVVTKVIVSHKDRFVRFGFVWFESFLNQHGCELEVIRREATTAEEEMVQDLISIIHVFSCRLYGLRKYKDVIRQDEELPSTTKQMELFQLDTTVEVLDDESI